MLANRCLTTYIRHKLIGVGKQRFNFALVTSINKKSGSFTFFHYQQTKLTMQIDNNKIETYANIFLYIGVVTSGVKLIHIFQKSKIFFYLTPFLFVNI